MMESELNRRQFTTLTSAALSGLIAGATLGCGSSSTPTATAADKHTCRGLNECKGQGADGKNACRGQGTCATVAHHDCGAENTCKGLGGCGENAGLNECAGKGGCHVPLMSGAWDTIRERLETKWTAAKLDFAAAPPEKK